MEKLSPLDILLRPELPDVRKQLPTEQVEVDRLSALAGTPVIFDLRAMTYSQVQRINDTRAEDRAAQAILMACTSPNWGDPRLLDPDHGIATPLDAIRAKLLPGEIDELFIHIQKLTGYLKTTLSDVKNG